MLRWRQRVTQAQDYQKESDKPPRRACARRVLAGRVRRLWRSWLLAQGVPAHDLSRWYDPTRFYPYPPKCILCGERWRPGDPEYVAVFGRILVAGSAQHGDIIRPERGLYTMSVLEWGDPTPRVFYPFHAYPYANLERASIEPHDIFNRPEFLWYWDRGGVIGTTGHLGDHIRHLCRYHGYQWPTVIDCETGLTVHLYDPTDRKVQAGKCWARWLHTFKTLLRFPVELGRDVISHNWHSPGG